MDLDITHDSPFTLHSQPIPYFSVSHRTIPHLQARGGAARLENIHGSFLGGEGSPFLWTCSRLPLTSTVGMISAANCEAWHSAVAGSCMELTIQEQQRSRG